MPGDTTRGRAARRRGATYERDLVAHLRARGFTGAERTARSMYDAQPRGDIAGLPGVHLEARNRARLELAAWLDEVHAATAGTPTVGVVVVKRRGTADRGRDYAVVDLDTLLTLLDPNP